MTFEWSKLHYRVIVFNWSDKTRFWVLGQSGWSPMSWWWIRSHSEANSEWFQKERGGTSQGSTLQRGLGWQRRSGQDGIAVVQPAQDDGCHKHSQYGLIDMSSELLQSSEMVEARGSHAASSSVHDPAVRRGLRRHRRVVWLDPTVSDGQAS